MTQNPYCCLDCGHNHLEVVEAGHQCPACGKLWLVHGGVSLFLPGVKVVENHISMPKDAWEAVCQSASLPASPENITQMRRIFSNNYNLPELHLSAENNYYFQRVPEMEKFLQGNSETAKESKSAEAIPSTANGPLHFHIERHYIPETIPAGQTYSWNVRIINDGPGPIHAKGPGSARLAHRWWDGVGNLIAMAGRPTTLPVDLACGRALSVPFMLSAPARNGLHLLEIGLISDSGEWISSESKPLLIQCVVGLELELPNHWNRLNKPQSTFDYVEDHLLGVSFLKEELKENRTPRLLEVGGCSSPMTHGMDGDIYVSDIDAQTLQVGRLRFASKFPNMKFLASDAARLPFAPGTFDGVVLFATLHHFADPIACLTEFRRVIKPDGFIMMGTEPVGSYMAETVDAKLLKELESGINEQVFTAQEYQRMFLAAGLFATRVEIDRGALRAILRPRAGGVAYSTGSDASTNSILIRQLIKLNLQWVKSKVKQHIGPYLPRRKAA